MRLTLRTLLAYLDDTLEPSEIKQIGQKVAESDAAQELIARIKQVTRKRRLTTPPLTGPGAKFDPNLIADYLDNELSGEQVAEIEKICLESDVHLAEIASCHQILTLVLGEPALVPPTARERMYGLVKGREAIPFRKASAKNTQAVGKNADGEEETAVLGLPVSKRHAHWLIWAIPIAGLFLFLALGFALYSALQGNHEQPRVANTDKTNVDKADGLKDGTDKPKVNPDDKPKVNPDDKPKVNPDDKPKVNPDDKPKVNPDDKPKNQPVLLERPTEPSKERVELASYEGSPRMGAPSILVARQPDQKTWSRVMLNHAVSSSDPLVSLPGYTSELRTKTGIHMLLWGTLPEFNPTHKLVSLMFEAAVTLHANPAFDLEFTLHRGRVYLSNHNDKPVKVRVRFEREIWDIDLLERDSEVVVELFKQYTSDINYQDGEEPLASFFMYVTKGKAGLRYNTAGEFPSLESSTGSSFFMWENKVGRVEGPIPVAQPIALFSKDPTTDVAKELREALLDLPANMTNTKQSVEVMLYEVVNNKAGKLPAERMLCIYGLGAIDGVSNLLTILASEDPKQGLERDAAMRALRFWLGRGPEAGKRLYEAKGQEGLLHDKGYTPTEADAIFVLLHRFTEADARRAETFELLISYLNYKKMAIRQLAYYQLIALSRPVKVPEYDPAARDKDRELAASKWKDLVNKKELPPAPPMGMPPK